MDMKRARVNVACRFGGFLFQRSCLRSCLRVSMAGIVLWAFSAGGGFAMARGKPAAAKLAKAER